MIALNLSYALIDAIGFYLLIAAGIYSCGHHIGYIRGHRDGCKDEQAFAHRQAKRFPTRGYWIDKTHERN